MPAATTTIAAVDTCVIQAPPDQGVRLTGIGAGRAVPVLHSLTCGLLSHQTERGYQAIAVMEQP